MRPSNLPSDLALLTKRTPFQIGGAPSTFNDARLLGAPVSTA